MLAIRRRNKRASLVAFYRLALAIQACPFPEPRVRENVKHSNCSSAADWDALGRVFMAGMRVF